mgnify:CR=1 FL=1
MMPIIVLENIIAAPMMMHSTRLKANKWPMQNPIEKNANELTIPTSNASLNRLISLRGCMSSPSKNNKKIIPILATLAISVGSDINDVPDGPRITPIAI